MSSALPPTSPVLPANMRRARAGSLLRHGNLGIAVGCTIIAGVLLAAYLAPLPYGPYEIDSNAVLQSPSHAHWFGTDTLGRDEFARVIRAGRTDLPLALLGTLFALVLGVAVGLIVSVKSKMAERVMRGLDMFQAFPLLILSVAIVSLAGNTLKWVVLAIAFIFAPLFTRLVRAEALALRESRFIEAAVAIGASRTRVLLRHMLPNLTGIILVQASLTASRAVLLIAALSYLGIGISPPTPSWGTIIQGGSAQLTSGQWWISAFPGMFVILCVLGFNLLGDGLEILLGRGARG